MQQRQDSVRQSIWNNLKWLAGSMALAFFVWMIATLDRDPVGQRVFQNIPIQVEHDQTLVVTYLNSDFANVTVRAPTSVLDQLVRADILVIADAHKLAPGDHTINLEASVSRRAITDTSPRRIRITLESLQEKLVPVTASITGALPRGYEIEGGNPVFGTNQVQVSGPQSKVDAVTAAQVVLNLDQRRNAFSDDLRLLPVDKDGTVIEDVTLDPPTVKVTVPIHARSDVRQISVTPNILADTLPAGYALSSIEYDPQVVFISGPPAALESAPGTLFTEPINLTDRTSDFEITANVQLPDERLFVVGEQTITVSIGITPLMSSRQFDRVPVETIGLEANLAVTLSPDTVTVLITGPQNTLETLETDDLRAVIDLNDHGAGTYQIAPEVTANVGEGVLTNISVLPTEVEVDIAPVAETTETPAAP